MSSTYAIDAELQEERDQIIDDVVSYAVNTSAMYRTHCSMAQENATVNRWRRWVRFTVLVHYRTEICAIPMRVSTGMALRMAQDLKTYYDAHIKEANP